MRMKAAYRLQKIILASLVFIFAHCGTNTDTPIVMAPLTFLTNPINTPQVGGVISTSEYDIGTAAYISMDQFPLRPEFIIKYFVTNTEQQFIGYNLSITSQTPTVAETQAGVAGSIYTENGIQPSFPHLSTENSTDPANMKRRRINYRIPPPGPLPFQKCEVYRFTLRAVLSNVPQQSNPSFAASACASPNAAKCEIGSSCNPTTCANAACSASDQASCSVGTLCNPCKFASLADRGCECPAGQSPPGCNP